MLSSTSEKKKDNRNYTYSELGKMFKHFENIEILKPYKYINHEIINTKNTEFPLLERR